MGMSISCMVLNGGIQFYFSYLTGSTEFSGFIFCSYRFLPAFALKKCYGGQAGKR